METMKGIICPRYGAPQVFQFKEVPKPEPKEDEVLIKIYAASVTNSDIFIRSAKLTSKLQVIPFRIFMGFRGPRNKIIGEVLSGKIEAVGSKVTRFKPGDIIYGLTGFSLGAYADYKCMKVEDSKQGCISLMPNNITYEDATSAAYGGLLALQAFEKVKIGKISKVLIYGASGTTGTFAIQYAKYLGAEVTAVCSNRNLTFVKELGADYTLDYNLDKSIEQLDKYDLVIDAVGIGKSSKLKIMAKKALTESGSYLSIDDEALLLDSTRLDRVTKLVETGAIKPITDKVFSFNDIVEAHRYVERGHKRGNVAITVNSAQYSGV